jgi:hypothetical protein
MSTSVRSMWAKKRNGLRCSLEPPSPCATSKTGADSGAGQKPRPGTGLQKPNSPRCPKSGQLGTLPGRDPQLAAIAPQVCRMRTEMPCWQRVANPDTTGPAALNVFSVLRPKSRADNWLRLACVGGTVHALDRREGDARCDRDRRAGRERRTRGRRRLPRTSRPASCVTQTGRSRVAAGSREAAACRVESTASCARPLSTESAIRSRPNVTGSDRPRSMRIERQG